MQNDEKILKKGNTYVLGANERKNEMDIFQDFLSEGKTDLNLHLKREGI